MIQSFIDKCFFVILVVFLVFAIILYSAIGFLYTDELCAAAFFLLFLYIVFKTPPWSFNKVFLLTLFVFLFYTIYSLWIGSNTKRAIFNDLVVQLKPYLAFFCAYQLKPSISESRKRMLRNICLIFWLAFLLPIGLISLVYEKIIILTMGIPASYGIAVILISLCYYYCSKYTLRDRIIFLCLLTIGIFSGRSKFYGFFVLAAFMMLFFYNTDRIKINLKNTLIIVGMVVVIVLVAWQKISYYFYDAISGSAEADKDMMARYILYAISPEILKDYFPFGSGLASFATNASGAISYSSIYGKYGIDAVWGLSKNYHDFVSDSYYPALAQFGVVGVILYLSFWIYIVRKIITYYKRTKNRDYTIIGLLIVGFLAIEGTTAATFIMQGGFFVMMLLGMILSCTPKETQLTEYEENTVGVY